MVRAAFVMEQHIGHRAYYENLRRFIDQSSSVEVSWIPITYQHAGILASLPLLPDHLVGTLSGRSEVRQALKNATYDVALFNTQVPAAIAGSIVRRKPYVLCTDITPLQYDEMSEQYGHRADDGGLLSRYKHWANVNLFRNAAKVLPWSSWAKASLMADYGVASEQIVVIPPGVDLDVWKPGTAVPDGPLQILFVGGDLYRKGGDVLLQAFRLLPEGCANLHLVTRTSLPPERGVAVYNTMQPNSPELMALYQSAHLFVLPTKAEAFGIALVEACAVGLPVIATAVGGVTDIVVEGENGFLTAADDVHALADHLQQLAANPGLRQQLGWASRRRAEELFDARQNAARVAQIVVESAAGEFHG
ncbi:MAG: glycosyltransferase family 4 protein [Chloroflexi bacterium]|nr:glycosyltransferase family 4 protein [Chloroflexota bacterium]